MSTDVLRSSRQATSTHEPGTVLGHAHAAGGSEPSASTVTPPSSLQLSSDPSVWANIAVTLATSGAVTGTLLDGIHSRTGLQVMAQRHLSHAPTASLCSKHTRT
jgi:hypothetical protein